MARNSEHGENKPLAASQEAGLELRLRFQPAHYGPYAENLRHVLGSIEGHFVSGYGDGGDQPDKNLELLPGAMEDARRALSDQSSYQSVVGRVADVVEGFESPASMELLASVHWVATRNGTTDEQEVVDRLREWSARKRRFSRRQVSVALDALRSRGWLEGLAQPSEETERT